MSDGVSEATYVGVIYPQYIDHMGHMNVQFYVALFDQATWILFDRVGLSLLYFTSHARGMAALEQHMQYHREVFAGTVVTITSEIVSVFDKTVRFRHIMRDHAEVAATCDMVGAHLDRVAHKAIPFPSEIHTNLVARSTESKDGRMMSP